MVEEEEVEEEEEEEKEEVVEEEEEEENEEVVEEEKEEEEEVVEEVEEEESVWELRVTVIICFRPQADQLFLTSQKMIRAQCYVVSDIGMKSGIYRESVPLIDDNNRRLQTLRTVDSRQSAARAVRSHVNAAILERFVVKRK
ncbi:unnamed protein product [Arctogadus glacialis]